MGYDVSYHPIKESEMKEWYFERVGEVLAGNDKRLMEVISENISDERFVEDWVDLIHEANKYDKELSFDSSHGVAVACIQGYVRDYYYTRGGVFSILKDEAFFDSCCKSWEEILQQPSMKREVHNRITENYCSGVYISHEGVLKLLEKIRAKDRYVIEKLLDVFGEDNLEVFVDALEASESLEAGLLEATEIVEPNPLDLHSTTCISNLLNCDFKGVAIYEKVVAQQIAEFTAKDHQDDEE